MSDVVNKKQQAIAQYEHNLVEQMATLGIPEHMRRAIRSYVMDGAPVSGFLTHVFNNNLAAAACNADARNGAALQSYGRLMEWYFPLDAFGSEKKVNAWLKSGGVNGRRARR